MDVVGGNVRVLCTPLVTSSVFHFVSSQIMFIGTPVPGLELALDGYVDSVMTTEDDEILTTED